MHPSLPWPANILLLDSGFQSSENPLAGSKPLGPAKTALTDPNTPLHRKEKMVLLTQEAMLGPDSRI